MWFFNVPGVKSHQKAKRKNNYYQSWCLLNDPYANTRPSIWNRSSINYSSECGHWNCISSLRWSGAASGVPYTGGEIISPLCQGCQCSYSLCSLFKLYMVTVSSGNLSSVGLVCFLLLVMIRGGRTSKVTTPFQLCSSSKLKNRWIYTWCQSWSFGSYWFRLDHAS